MSAAAFTRQQIRRLESFLAEQFGECLPLVCFTHDITTHAGRFGMLTSQPIISALYQEQEVPLSFFNPDGSRIMAAGFHTSRMLTKLYSDASPSAHVYFDAVGASHNVCYCEKLKDKDHLYTFSFHCSDSEFDGILLNKKEQLLDFVKIYHFINQSVIKDALNQDNSTTFSVDYDSAQVTKAPVFIHTRLGMMLDLTPRQSDCLTCLFRGDSAKIIARHLSISHRTVEEHLAVVRQKYHFKSTQELLVSVKMIA